MVVSRAEVTELLHQWSVGRQEALEQLLPAIYGELKRLAGSYLRRERPDHTLQTTALVHEAFLKLVDQRDVRWQNRAHFFGIAAQIMRRILVNHARAHTASNAAPESGRSRSMTRRQSRPAPDVDVLALDEALTRLAAVDPQQSRVVELRFFGGLTIEETAEVLGISPATVSREWTLAKAWLYAELGAAPHEPRSMAPGQGGVSPRARPRGRGARAVPESHVRRRRRTSRGSRTPPDCARECRQLH